MLNTLSYDGFLWKSYLQFEKYYIPSRIFHLSRKTDFFPFRNFYFTLKKYIHEYMRSENNIWVKDTQASGNPTLHYEYEDELSLMWTHSISFWLATSQKTTVSGGLIQGLQKLFDLGITLSKHSPLTIQVHLLHPQKTFSKDLGENSLLSVRHQWGDVWFIFKRIIINSISNY